MLAKVWKVIKQARKVNDYMSINIQAVHLHIIKNHRGFPLSCLQNVPCAYFFWEVPLKWTPTEALKRNIHKQLINPNKASFKLLRDQTTNGVQAQISPLKLFADFCYTLDKCVYFPTQEHHVHPLPYHLKIMTLHETLMDIHVRVAIFKDRQLW